MLRNRAGEEVDGLLVHRHLNVPVGLRDLGQVVLTTDHRRARHERVDRSEPRDGPVDQRAMAVDVGEVGAHGHHAVGRRDRRQRLIVAIDHRDTHPSVERELGEHAAEPARAGEQQMPLRETQVESTVDTEVARAHSSNRSGSRRMLAAGIPPYERCPPSMRSVAALM